MTREEVIKMFRKEIECLSHSRCEDCILEKACNPMKTPLDSEYIEAYEIAIKALEQETKQYFPVDVLNCWIGAEVLDKIKAEIEAKCCITVGKENDGAITLHDVFQIIDKYKAESEV